MALDNTVNVEITATVDKFNKGLVKAEKDLKGFEKQTDKVTGTTNKMGKSVKSNAVPALTSFSQVVQDAPYGIRGVANNITQLTSQFGYLSKSTGGAKAALKAMLGTLSGPAGILLVVSLVTSALVAYGDKLKFSSDKASKLKDEQEKLTKSLTEYKESLFGVQKAQLQGAQSAAKELTNLRLLKAQLDNTNLSQKDRVAALNELQKKYPSYLGSVSQEDALVGGLDTKYDELSAAILKTAKAKAAAQLISENYRKILNLEAQVESKNAEITTAKTKKQIAANNALAASRNLNDRGFSSSEQAVKDYNSTIEDGTEAVKGFKDEIKKLDEANTKLAANVAANGGVVPLNFKPKIDKDSKLTAEDLLDLSDLENEFDLSGLDQMLEDADIGRRLGEAIDAAAFTNALYKLTDGMDEWLEGEFTDKTTKLNDKLVELNEGINSLITGTISDTLGKLGNAIGEALATGGNVAKAIGETIIQGMANFIGQLGKMLIEYGTMAVIKGKLDLAIATGGPAAIAAGAAAIAVGFALSAISGAIGGFSSSGGASSSSDYSSSGSDRGYGSSVSYGGGAGGGTVVFEIAGTKLVGVLSNTLNENTALSGNLSVN